MIKNAVQIKTHQLFSFVNEFKQLVILKGSLFICDNGEKWFMAYGQNHFINVPHNVNTISYSKGV